MRNIVGQIPTGEDFFPRERVIRRIYRRLDTGTNVFLSAPRRVGKTAIMRYLEDNPRENYEFTYLIVEAVDEASTYFKRLLDALKALKSLTKRSLDALSGFLGRINEVTLFDVGIGLESGGEVDTSEEFKKLLKALDTADKKVVIMIDEFPQAVENIRRKHGDDEARRFLQLNRAIRHELTENRNIVFLLTGSIGLPTIVEKLTATPSINDLNPVNVPPLERADATKMSRTLLDSSQVPYDSAAVEHLLDQMEGWFVPFHIQIIVQELIDFYDDTGASVDPEAVDRAFASATHPRNDMYFEHYYSRLKRTFEENEFDPN